MSHMIRSLAAVALFAGLAAPALAAPAAAPPTPAELGRAVFMAKNCYFCHGTLGQGGTPTGAALAPKPIPIAAMRAYIRHPRGQMPAFSPETVSDADIDAIHAYLESIPPGRPASEIPLLGGVAPAKAK